MIATELIRLPADVEFNNYEDKAQTASSVIELNTFQSEDIINITRVHEARALCFNVGTP